MSKIPNPQNQTTGEIVKTLLVNEERKYTESAHAEIFARLMDTIKEFDSASREGGRRIFWLTLTIVSLTVLNVVLSVFNFLTR